MINELIALKLDVESLKTHFGNSIAIGPIEEIDADKGYRIKLGEDEEGAILSPWYPHPETGKTSIPLKKGQIVGSVNPNGDPRQGILIRGGYSDENISSNKNMNANVFSDAGVTVSIKDGELLIESGGCTFSFSGNGFYQTGGRQDHDGKNTGKDHNHPGILPGPANTGPPNS